MSVCFKLQNRSLYCAVQEFCPGCKNTPLAMSVNPVKFAKAEEAEEAELVDFQQKLRDECNTEKKIEALREKYQACNDRVNSRSRTTEVCSEELNDWLHEVDHCVTKTLFSHLK